MQLTVVNSLIHDRLGLDTPIACMGHVRGDMRGYAECVSPCKQIAQRAQTIT